MKQIDTEDGAIMVSEEVDGKNFDPNSMVEKEEAKKEVAGNEAPWLKKQSGVKLSHLRDEVLDDKSTAIVLDVVEHYRCSVEPNFATKEPVVTVEFDMHKNEASELFNVLVHKPDGIDTVNLKSAESVLEVVSVKKLDVEDCYKVRGYRRFVRLTFTASSNM